MSVVRKFSKFITRRARNTQNNVQLISRFSLILANLDFNHYELLSENRRQIDYYIASNCNKSRKIRVEATKYNSLSSKDIGFKNLSKKILLKTKT